jgi:hypothetical protein
MAAHGEWWLLESLRDPTGRFPGRVSLWVSIATMIDAATATIRIHASIPSGSTRRMTCVTGTYKARHG